MRKASEVVRVGKKHRLGFTVIGTTHWLTIDGETVENDMHDLISWSIVGPLVFVHILGDTMIRPWFYLSKVDTEFIKMF